jgi:hypothetical protein
MRALLFLAVSLASPLEAKTRPALVAPEGRVIHAISFESKNVFDPEVPSEGKLLYRVADRIHIRTHEKVISREILFAVGDRYDPALAAETERNLRALPFLRAADVEPVVNKDGTVDVFVRTYDSWSLEVVAGFKRAGGSSEVKAGLTDHNIAGSGKLLSAVYDRVGTSDSKQFGYQDPQSLNTKHLQTALSAVESPGTQNYALSVLRPFYASIVPWAAGGSASYTKGAFGTFNGQVSAGSVSKSVTEAGLNYGVAVTTSTARTRRVTLGFLAHGADFRPIPAAVTGPIPDRERMGFFQLSGDWEELDFLTVRRIQKFTHDEDYNLGVVVLPSLAWAPFVRAWGSTQSQFVPAVTVAKGFTWADQLMFVNAGYSAKYVNGADSNRIASAGATYYVRGLRYQTFAFHSALDLGWKLDPGAPLILGEANGLRGYGLNAFSGSRRFLFNVEDRIFVWDELWRLVDVGSVLFYDSGYSWPAPNTVRFGDLKDSVGVGLRLAPSRSADNSPVRIDLAYALSSNQTRSRWSLSILAGQAFH